MATPTLPHPLHSSQDIQWKTGFQNGLLCSRMLKYAMSRAEKKKESIGYDFRFVAVLTRIEVRIVSRQ